MSIQQVYDHWNSKPKHHKWKRHQKLTTKMTSAISDRLCNWTVEDLCGMIDNFYMCKTDKRFKIYHNHDWPKWSLSVFFTRGCTDGDGKGLRCEWFEAEEFDEYGKFTDKYKQLQRDRNAKSREQDDKVNKKIDEYSGWILEKSIDEIKASRQWRDPDFREAVKILKGE
jgi:hypothetical protein